MKTIQNKRRTSATQGPSAQPWINMLSLQTTLKQPCENIVFVLGNRGYVSRLQQQNNAKTTVSRLTIYVANTYIYRGNR